LRQRKYLYNNSGINSYLDAKEIIPLIVNIIENIKSIVDLGGGLGGWCKALEEYGIKNVICIDHPSIELNKLLIDKEKFIPCDFEKEYPPIIESDLAISIEFAEHISEKHSLKIIDYLTSCSKIILFSAAVPGQGGLGHINEQWPSYWLDRFLDRAYYFLDIIRPHIIGNEKLPLYIRQNLFLIVHKDFINRIKISKSFGFSLNDWTLVSNNILEKKGFKNKIKKMLPGKMRGKVEFLNHLAKLYFSKIFD